jgi:hypothetical protein
MAIEDERWEHFTKQPFRPERGAANTADLGVQIRTAHALEYIAAQLGILNSKLDKLIEQKEKTEDRSTV